MFSIYCGYWYFAHFKVYTNDQGTPPCITYKLHIYYKHMYVPLGYIPGSTNEARRKVEQTNKYNTTMNTVPRIGTNAFSPSSMYLSKIFLIL